MVKNDNNMAQDMQRLVEKIDSLRELLEEKIGHIASGLDKIDEVEKRTSFLEGRYNFLLGVWAVVSVVIVGFYAMLPSLMDSLFLERLTQPLIKKGIISIVDDEFFNPKK